MDAGHNIFISYRRSDSAYITGMINERLSERFGRASIFTDVDSIPLGEDFKNYIDSKVSQCKIMLVVIGKEWVTVRDENDRIRLKDPNDFVRIEVESALKRDIPVIPLFVQGAGMPVRKDLPNSLKPLTNRNGMFVRPHPDFKRDIELLINALTRKLNEDRLGTPIETEKQSSKLVQDEKAHRATQEDSAGSIDRMLSESSHGETDPHKRQTGKGSLFSKLKSLVQIKPAKSIQAGMTAVLALFLILIIWKPWVTVADRTYKTALSKYESGVYGEAFSLASEIARNNDPEGMCLLGQLYENGHGVTKDYSQALEWYIKASDGGNTAAKYHLGNLYEYGNGVVKDYNKAFQYYKRAAEEGDASAMSRLGYLYHNGLGVVQDHKKALEWYTKGANGGNDFAMANVGYFHESGLAVPQDYPTALEWYEKARVAGNNYSTYKVGYFNHFGLGTIQNYQKAFESYDQAAKEGNALAMNNIGLLYENGLGVTKNYYKALEWYRKSAESGESAAMNNIGLVYKNGLGVSVDYPQALEWFNKSVQAGNVSAKNNLGVMYEHGQGVTQDYGKALEWYQQAADGGNEVAMFNLGLFYEFGRGVTKNTTLANEFYQRSAAKGYERAKNKLGL